MGTYQGLYLYFVNASVSHDECDSRRMEVERGYGYGIYAVVVVMSLAV
jgi:hypothetical protein